MDSIRQTVAFMQDQQIQQLFQHEVEISRRIWYAHVAFISLLGTSALVLGAVFAALQLHLARRSRAMENTLRLHRELEPLTHSVSHDLHARLRSIHGYSQILQVEYGEKLDTSDRRVANTVMKNAAVANIGIIRQAWMNLISNAIKYSSKKEFPQVWINAFETGTEIVYSIRDNGVGFDMQYVHKLFAVPGQGATVFFSLPRTINPNDR
jgi:light-regulated signal transduction histidine kinase (bacteriophytochrome)